VKVLVVGFDPLRSGRPVAEKRQKRGLQNALIALCTQCATCACAGAKLRDETVSVALVGDKITPIRCLWGVWRQRADLNPRFSVVQRPDGETSRPSGGKCPGKRPIERTNNYARMDPRLDSHWQRRDAPGETHWCRWCWRSGRYNCVTLRRRGAASREQRTEAQSQGECLRADTLQTVYSHGLPCPFHRPAASQPWSVRRPPHI
jgi:hypothetical protein